MTNDIDSDVVISGWRLTKIQVAFCQHVSQGLSFEDAAERAGIDPTIGRMWMTKPHIRKYLRILEEEKE